MKNISKISTLIVLLLIVLTLSTFTVDQREHAIVFRLGEIVSVKDEPGLYIKAPIIDNVRFLEKRIMTYDPPQPDRFITSEKKNVYKTNKYLAIEYCKQMVQSEKECFQDMFLGSKKKDDLSDSFLQGVFWILKKNKSL